MNSPIKKRVKNHQYFGELAIAEFLTKNNVVFKIKDGVGNRREFLIKHDSDSQYTPFIEVSKGGVIRMENYSSKDSEKNKTLSDQLIKENSCELTTEMVNEYNKIKRFMTKNNHKVDKYLGLLFNGYFAIYAKNKKRLYVYPNIEYSRHAASGNIFGETKKMHEPGYFVNLIHDEAYYLMSNFLEKPLNQYTDDELLLMDMVEI